MRISDWSSDVCSSDLSLVDIEVATDVRIADHFADLHVDDLRSGRGARDAVDQLFHIADRRRAVQFGCDEGPLALHAPDQPRSEERRVGKECASTCRSRWSTDT